ncbi:hypothetical protein AGMMS5026_05070 [Endomicrobiia bacterium]|nr:hypothetical protein AGMMS49523_00040 [Endomicrobiia bacterium]GHT11297.1 hypothetical protein AGMMS49571_01400 [Endomicrobiia bacterium]GHT19551.1 hypothetical protein AGMMS49929_03530 [Endomicrobiia bacterium]GHT25626.1 hypothetical protein AGMMS49995_00040 [Endomicrobiia bacterium]GHT30538.1 hypothetical protein AGMMS5026_05070 [Endomicrobiia bacterium]
MIAYIRFASVYRKFDDISTFMKELQKLKKEYVKRRKKKIKNFNSSQLIRYIGDIDVAG